MPLGPNSLASDCANALSANLPAAKEANCAEPFTLAVAPVKMRVGGYFKPPCDSAGKSGRTFCAKLNAPFLYHHISIPYPV